MNCVNTLLDQKEKLSNERLIENYKFQQKMMFGGFTPEESKQRVIADELPTVLGQRRALCSDIT